MRLPRFLVERFRILLSSLPGRITRRAMPFLIAAGIFYVSHQPSLPSVPLFPYQDKVYHVIIFFLLGTALAWNRDILPGRIRWPGIAAIAMLYGLLDEIHQAYVPGRDCSYGDFAADMLGVVLGVTVSWRLTRRWRSSSDGCSDLNPPGDVQNRCTGGRSGTGSAQDGLAGCSSHR